MKGAPNRTRLVAPRAGRVHSLLHTWADNALAMARKPGGFCGCRKILSPARLTFPILSDDLQMEHVGYTRNKMRQLERHYIHQESIDVAKRLWTERCAKKKYGSVGFTCYNHFIKSERKSPRGSVMGPCIQAVSITWRNRESASVDAFYRTTELFKKFPADLVFIRDRLLSGFDFGGLSVSLTCHFANVTIHPMYFIALWPHLDDPLRRLSELKDDDRRLHDWIVKWTARYVCEEYGHGIEKFAQAMRVKDFANAIDTAELAAYLRANHPGYSNAGRRNPKYHSAVSNGGRASKPRNVARNRRKQKT